MALEALEDGRKALRLSFQVGLRFVRDALPGVGKLPPDTGPAAF
jgi:hypothetical protein